MNSLRDPVDAERDAMIERYSRRTQALDPCDPWMIAVRQEVERALAAWVREDLRAPAGDVSLLDVGCGAGASLNTFIRLGMSPRNLAGIELLPDRVLLAQRTVPTEVRLLSGDAIRMLPQAGAFDVVFQSMVFSSILDDDVQVELARRMWSVARPGGGVLWYDFVYDNPRNPDVRGVRRRRIRQLFPEADPVWRRVTLAPPIGRWTARRGSFLYQVVDAIPLLRTHVLVWLRKAGLK